MDIKIEPGLKVFLILIVMGVLTFFIAKPTDEKYLADYDKLKHCACRKIF